jgi:hypothetical protein
MLDKELMGTHLHKNGFTSNYTRWVHHGEADLMKEEVVSPSDSYNLLKIVRETNIIC